MSYEQKDEPNEKKPGGNNPKKNFWTPLIIALALVLLFGWIYNMVSDSQYTETTYADFYTAMENHQLAEVQRRGSRIYYLTKEDWFAGIRRCSQIDRNLLAEQASERHLQLLFYCICYAMSSPGELRDLSK